MSYAIGEDSSHVDIEDVDKGKPCGWIDIECYTRGDPDVNDDNAAAASAMES